jgi:hypothetical protein
VSIRVQEGLENNEARCYSTDKVSKAREAQYAPPPVVQTSHPPPIPNIGPANGWNLTIISPSWNFQLTMSHRNVAASTTIILQATSVAIASESPQLKTYMRSLMEQSGLTEQEVRKRAVETYGSLEYAKQAMETAEAENKAAIERAFPKGYAEIQVGVSDVAFLNLRPTFQRVLNASVNLNPEKR